MNLFSRTDSMVYRCRDGLPMAYACGGGFGTGIEAFLEYLE